MSARISRHEMPFGAQIEADGRVSFRIWAPKHQRVELELLTPQPSVTAMSRSGDGWHSLTSDRAQSGARYHYLLPDGQRVPDPASRYQPLDVHGPSEVIDPDLHGWQDDAWRGRPWNEAVIYELHVGCFTEAGTFRAAIERLDQLQQLGVTALELMPVADFPGKRNWGYDGVLPFAPDASYGRPEDLKALIDAAHARGLMVILDVVYNHFGPEGNYLSAYAPQFFNDKHTTPWGAAVNFDSEGSEVVREFVCHNALYWLHEFHLDGLRLDAVHEIRDDSPVHILTQLAQRVRAAGFSRPIHLILENENNQVGWLRREHSAAVLYNAQWNDDAHHVLHVATCGEAEGYYADYLDDTDKLGRALAQGFAFQGESMPYRGTRRGEPSAHLPPDAFIAFIQNHDQIGNRALGERITAVAKVGAVRAAAAVYLLLPQIPMLFMGEEWHSDRPFQFFCDFGGNLADAVRDGRRQEFARFAAFSSASAREKIPDPQSASTFSASKLDWEVMQRPEHASAWRRYQDLLAVRRRHIVPRLPQMGGGEYTVIAPGAIAVHWNCADGARLSLLANLSDQSVTGFPEEPGQLLWEDGLIDTHHTYPAWALRWILRT